MLCAQCNKSAKVQKCLKWKAFSLQALLVRNKFKRLQLCTSIGCSAIIVKWNCVHYLCGLVFHIYPHLFSFGSFSYFRFFVCLFPYLLCSLFSMCHFGHKVVIFLILIFQYSKCSFNRSPAHLLTRKRKCSLAPYCWPSMCNYPNRWFVALWWWGDFVYVVQVRSRLWCHASCHNS